VFLFSVLSFLPFELLVVLFAAASLVCLVAVTKRWAVAWIFFIPVLQTLAVGQWDLIALWLAYVDKPIGYALLTLKPHLFIVALPRLLQNPQAWKRTAIYAAIMWLPSFLVRPLWPLEWLQHIDDGRLASGTGASLWAAPIIILLVGVAAAIGFKRFGAFATALNPGMRPYDYTMLVGKSLWLIPLSWAVLWVMWQVGSPWVWAVLGYA
jgi:hypothetical protein